MTKKLTAILLIAALVFMLAACGTAGAKLSGAGNFITYIKHNNITTESYEPEDLAKDKGEKDHYNSLKVTGLKDERVQETINSEITAAIAELKEAPMPEYEGIEKSFSGKATGETITAKAKGSINNILSVLVTKTVYQSGSAWTDTRTLNFNLRNGKKLSLKDIFKKESKPGTKLAEVCLAYLEDNGGLKEKETPEFTDEQKFYIDADGIHVLYDYATGGVETPGYKAVEAIAGFNSVYEGLDLEQCLTANSLFEDETESYMLVPSEADTVESENNIPDRTNLAMIQYLSWPSDIPDKVLKAVQNEAEVSEDEINAVDRIVKAGSGIYHYNDMANCRHIGNYFNIFRSKSLFGPGMLTEDKICSVYDAEGRKLSLDDIFVQGTEYKKIIMKALKESLANYYDNEKYDGKTLDEVYENLSFVLDRDGVGFWTQGLKLKNKNGDNHESSVNFFIEYDEFGCSNMTIFN